MTILKMALEQSVCLRPFVGLAHIDSEQLYDWWNRSIFGAVTMWLAGLMNMKVRRQQENRFLNAFLHRNCLFSGVALLFIISAFLQTSSIGILTWLLFGFIIATGLLLRRVLVKSFTIVDVIVIGFFVSAAISAAFSSYVYPSFVGLLKMMTFLAGYVVFRSFCDHGNRFIIGILWVLVVLGLTEAIIGYLQLTTGLQPLATWQDPNINPELKMTRIYGSLQPSNPNLLAGFLIPCFAAAIGLTTYYLTRGWRWSFLTIITLFASAATLAALVMTGSRGGYLAIIAMLISIFMLSGHLIFHQIELQKHRILKFAWVGILALSLLGGIYVFATSEKIQTRVTSMFAMRDDSSISYRMNVYKSATEMFQHNWLIGIGPGNETFKQVYGLYMVPGYNALASYSVPLEIAVEQGIIGLFLFLLLIGVLCVRVGLFMDSSRPLKDKILVSLLLVGTIGSLVYGIFDTIWYRPSVNLLFWFFVAGISQITERLFDDDDRLDLATDMELTDEQPDII